MEDSCIDLDTKTIHIQGEINFDISLEISKHIPRLESVTVYINSYGGFLDPAISIISQLQSLHKVTTIVTGIAYSAAAFIALCGTHRVASKFSCLMFHDPIMTFEEEKIEEIYKISHNSRQHCHYIVKELLKNTELPYKEYIEKIKDDWYVFPKEAKKYGLIDEIR